MSRLIALEETAIPIEHYRDVWPVASSRDRLKDQLTELGEMRIAAMDAAQIDVQVLSVAAPAAQAAPAHQSAELARALNDRLAAAVALRPSRFAALASVPTPDPQGAVAEVRRAILELGFSGVIINGHTNGRFLDAPDFDPILGAIEDLGVPLYLHPTFPPPAVSQAYYSGLEPEIARVLSTGGWGWHAETGLHVLRLAASGVLDRHRGLRIVVGHMGENLPFSLMRADSRLGDVLTRERSVAEAVVEQVWLTICGYTTVAPLRCALDVFGKDRVMFSTDYPFGDTVEHAEFLRTAPISAETRDRIAFRNAEEIFKLPKAGQD